MAEKIRMSTSGKFEIHSKPQSLCVGNIFFSKASRFKKDTTAHVNISLERQVVPSRIPALAPETAHDLILKTSPSKILTFLLQPKIPSEFCLNGVRLTSNNEDLGLKNNISRLKC